MTDKFELDIPVLLPEVPDAADACVGRLVSTLSAKPGVERAHVLPADGNRPSRPEAAILVILENTSGTGWLLLTIAHARNDVPLR